MRVPIEALIVRLNKIVNKYYKARLASLIVPISAESRYKMINDDLKEFINEVCGVLEIPVPNISDDFRVFENNTRMAVFEIEKNVPTLYLNDQMETEQDYYFAVAHELRHLWQYLTNEKHWLVGYKTAEEIGITAYNRQRLEIDANAFAALIMVLSFGMVPTFQSLDLETRHMIEVRARQIMPELDD